MSMIFLTRKEHFNAAHKLARADWSDEKNNAVFGKCSNPNWHGHNYTLYVTIKGKPSVETGFVMDLKQLSSIIKTQIIDEIDHKNVNLDVTWMRGIMPSTENLAIAIFSRLKALIMELGADLHSVKLHETDNNYVEYFGQ